MSFYLFSVFTPLPLADLEGGGRDVRPPKKRKKTQINTKKINGEERKQRERERERERERREVQSLRHKLS